MFLDNLDILDIIVSQKIVDGIWDMHDNNELKVTVSKLSTMLEV